MNKITSTQRRLIFTAKAFGINILLSVISLFVLQQFAPLDKIPPTPLSHAFEESTIKVVLSACILAPLLEEGIFRLPLIPTKMNLLIFVSLISTFIGSILFDFTIVSWTSLAIIVVSFFISGRVLSSADQFIDSFHSFYQRSFIAVILIVSLLFAYIHYTKVDFISNPSLLLLLLPQFFIGVILSVVRLKAGIQYSIIFHMIHNSLILLPSLLFFKH